MTRPAPEAEEPEPDLPVASVEERLTVKGKKPRDKEKKPELVGPPFRKVWLAEVCPLEESEGGTWLDRSQNRLGWGVCRATIWFDGLFGDERAIEERDATYGFVQPQLNWNKIDGLDPDVRFRAKINLPVADRRFNALLGRTTSNEPSSHSSDASTQQLPESFRDPDDEWLVGLGYSPVRGNRRRLDFDAGVELGAPVEIFTQGRYRRHWFVSPRDLVRLRQSVFWRSDDGFGTRLDFDFERVLGGPYVMRWRNNGTFAQHLEGMKWFDELTLFHRLGERQALAYVVHAAGETDAEVPVEEYGLELVYRRNILREWLFVEMRPGVEWRRPDVERRRQLTPLLGVGLEIQFGNREFE
ncbi:MAG TPA: hypothetical protein VMS86_02460 [Thermoanaerobaculia bacterium]|nr:hypothetical protein [Thermoanaerobaculia bacterium]